MVIYKTDLFSSAAELFNIIRMDCKKQRSSLDVAVADPLPHTWRQ